MKPQEAVKKETRHIAVGTLVMAAVMVGVFAVLGSFALSVLFGALYGSAVAIANFFLLGLSVQRMAETANVKEMDTVKLIKLRMQRSYTLRVVACAGLMIVAISVLKLNWIACLCPLIFPRLTILLMSLKNRPRGVRGSDMK